MTWHDAWQRVLGLYASSPSVTQWCASAAIFALCWPVLWGVVGSEAYPGSHLFALWVAYGCAVVCGALAQRARLPPLLGMLLVGIALRNVPVVGVGADIHPAWATALRSFATSVILFRAGLGLNLRKLRAMGSECVRLTIIPNVLEATTGAVMAWLLFDLPPAWGGLLGFVLSAISPAVVVPSLLHLQGQGYGVDKGIPSLVLAAASVDDVLSISGFGICLALAFSEGSVVLVALMGPMELVGGALAGVLLGGLCALLLPSRLPRAQRPSKLLQPHRMELPALSSEDAAVDDDGGAAAEGGEGVVAGLEDVELGEGPEREVPAHEHAAREHDALGEEKSDRAVGDEAGSQRSRDSQRGSHERDLAAEALEAEAEERRVARMRPLRFGMVLLMAVGAFLIASRLRITAAGALCAMVLGVVVAQSCSQRDTAALSAGMARVWLSVGQPFLFVLIGSAVSFSDLTPEFIGKGLALLAVGLTVRLIASYAAVMGPTLTHRERLFIALAWLPKATVQAAIGSIALERARDGGTDEDETRGLMVLTLAVLAILVTAPVGAAIISVSGPRLLMRAKADA